MHVAAQRLGQDAPLHCCSIIVWRMVAGGTTADSAWHDAAWCMTDRRAAVRGVGGGGGGGGGGGVHGVVVASGSRLVVDRHCTTAASGHQRALAAPTNHRLNTQHHQHALVCVVVAASTLQAASRGAQHGTHVCGMMGPGHRRLRRR